MPPFVVFALPRSRTAWISAFLTYREWQCGHDEVRHCRSLDDVASWFSQPCVGSVETAAAPFWRVLREFGEIRVAVVRRPVAEVVASLQAAMPGAFDTAVTTRAMQRLDRKLQQIERRLPNVVSVTFDELRSEAGCRRLWEHCLPYPFDAERYAAVAPVNLQISLPKLVRYFEAHKPQLVKLAKFAEHRILSRMQPLVKAEFDGMTFQTEPFRQFRHEAAALITDHSVEVGRRPWIDVNVPMLEWLDAVGGLQTMTARANGRCFGYLVSLVGPSLEGEGIVSGMHTMFYTSPDVRGLGVRLLMRANEALRERGVHEIFMRAGVAGSGPRMGAVYRRLGAQQYGELYKLEA